jgi:predicted CXXCH cytochrome family protein
MKRLIIATLVLFGLSVGMSQAGSVYPEIPKATGEAHPEGSEYWRVNHMDLLRHDRDLTMREGIRDTDASLAECVTCHAVNGPDAKPVTVKSEEHFCRVCHDYAAVKIDCFQCHNSVPPELGEASLMFKDETETLDVLLAYIEGLSQ